MSVRDSVRTFIKDSFLVDHFSDDDSFMGTSLIDSMGVLQLVAFVESEFKFKVGDADLVPENFDSVSRVVGFVERAQARAA